MAQIGRLVDALDNIHFYLRACVARDIPVEQLDLNTYYAAISNTTKHVTGNCFTISSLNEVIEMGEMIAGGVEALRERPFISFVTSWTVSPLRFAPETVEVLTQIVPPRAARFFIVCPPSRSHQPGRTCRYPWCKSTPRNYRVLFSVS